MAQGKKKFHYYSICTKLNIQSSASETNGILENKSLDIFFPCLYLADNSETLRGP